MKVEAVSHAAPSNAIEAKKQAPTRSSSAGPALAFDVHEGVTREYLQRALTTRIGKNVEEVLGKYGLSLDDAVGVDVSAEATSDRIVAGTTSLLGIFARQNPNLDQATLIDKFEATIRGGIDRGYHEARGILGAMAGFDDSIRELGMRTISMVHEKLDAWFTELRDRLLGGDSASNQDLPTDTPTASTRPSRGTATNSI